MPMRPRSAISARYSASSFWYCFFDLLSGLTSVGSLLKFTLAPGRMPIVGEFAIEFHKLAPWLLIDIEVSVDCFG